MTRDYTIADLRARARRRLPKAVFDFIDGGAEDEVTLRRNESDFERVELKPRIMVDVSRRDLSASILGLATPFPMAVGPTGLAALAWAEGDIALARAAHRFGIPFTVSTAASVRLEAIAAAVPGARLWFQMYMYKDREMVRSLVRRAFDAGFEALVYTADLPLLGQRERDLRNGFTVPLRPNARLVFDLARCPRWTLGVLAHGIPRMQNFVEPGRTSLEALAALTAANMDASVEWSSIAWLRDIWPKKIILKGLVSPEDAETAVGYGFDAVVVSNHGGRQLDGAVSTISRLPAVVDAVAGRAEVFIDGGIRRGTSIAKALALGARAVLLGRATLYGLGARGEAGADRALSILRDELDRCLALLGCAAAGRLDRSYVDLQ